MHKNNTVSLNLPVLSVEGAEGGKVDWGSEHSSGDIRVTLLLSDITLSQSYASAQLSPPPIPPQTSVSRLLRTRAAAGADAAESEGPRPCSFHIHDRRYQSTHTRSYSRQDAPSQWPCMCMVGGGGWC